MRAPIVHPYLHCLNTQSNSIQLLSCSSALVMNFNQLAFLAIPLPQVGEKGIAILCLYFLLSIVSK